MGYSPIAACGQADANDDEISRFVEVTVSSGAAASASQDLALDILGDDNQRHPLEAQIETNFIRTLKALRSNL